MSERAETIEYTIRVRLFKGDENDTDYGIFRKSIQKAFEMTLPRESNSAQAKLISLTEKIL